MKYLLITIAALVLVGCGPSVDIHDAAKAGDIEAVKQHLAAGTDVNAKEIGGNTPLHVTATSRHKEMAELLVMIREGRFVSATASADMYRHLTRSYWDDEALSQIPPTVQAASKQGAVSQSRSEVVLVNAPHGDYVFSIITDNQTDESWTHDNEGFMLIRSLSKLLWDHFEH